VPAITAPRQEQVTFELADDVNPSANLQAAPLRDKGVYACARALPKRSHVLEPPRSLSAARATTRAATAVPLSDAGARELETFFAVIAKGNVAAD
jgi:hypothetical protein